ncbi:MAG: nicotinate-nucleotide--dimethylbenzimidazole phosphoribosyltransferase [Hyphomicrobiales bacterium]
MTVLLQDIIDGIRPLNRDVVERARARTARLVMPPRALGRLHEISERLCGIQGTLKPSVRQKAVLVMAGDHGIVEEGISAFPQEVTGAMIGTFLAGGAGINAIARQVGAEVWVADMGIIPEIDAAGLKNGDRLLARKVGRGTRNFAHGPAMSPEDARKAVLTGFELASSLIRKGVDLLGTGDMGIGNTTPSAAIGAVITGRSVQDMVGPGTGVDDAGLSRKRETIRRGVDVNRPDPRDGLDVLAKVGGFEIGGIAGIALAGAYHRKPIVIDGFISTAGALIAHSLCPTVADYMFAGHCSEEPGHRHMLGHLKLAPILNLGMRLGEGTGGALAMGVIEAAIRVMTEVLTFEEAGVPDKE